MSRRPSIVPCGSVGRPATAPFGDRLSVPWAAEGEAGDLY